MRVLHAAEVSGPIGAVIDVDRSGADDGVISIAVAGDVDVLSVPRLWAAIGEHIGRSDVVVDLSGVAFCDSSSLRLFVDAQRVAAASRRTFELTHPSVAVRELFEVSGLRGVLRVTA